MVTFEDVWGWLDSKKSLVAAVRDRFPETPESDVERICRDLFERMKASKKWGSAYNIDRFAGRPVGDPEERCQYYLGLLDAVLGLCVGERWVVDLLGEPAPKVA